jgi:hypothetical protein
MGCRHYLLVLFSLLFAVGVSAATLHPPEVDYSAERIIASAQGEIRQRVYASAGKERMETTMGGNAMVNILRRDRQLMWMLMPAQRMYMEIDASAAQAQQPVGPEPGVELTELGSERLDGTATTKYRMVSGDGSVNGFVWLTADNIPLKTEMQGEGGERIVVRLEKLRLERQDPALFELPAGYSKLPVPGVLPR